MIIIYICMHMTCCVDGQSGDIQRPEDQALVHPRNDVDKRAYKSQIGGPDRFRFYYIGLGKRSGKYLIEDPGFITHDMASNKYFNNHHKTSSLFDIWKISKQKSPGLTNAHLTNTMVYRRMMSNTFDKRDPELFSEDLYPIQSGKQLFETYMDSALDQTQRWDEEMSQQGEIVDEIYTIEMAKQLNSDTYDNVLTEPPASQIKTQSFEFSFFSPDIDISSNPSNNGGNSIDKAEAKGDTKKNGGRLQTDLTNSDCRSQVNGHLVVDITDMLTLPFTLLVLGESNVVFYH